MKTSEEKISVTIITPEIILPEVKVKVKGEKDKVLKQWRKDAAEVRTTAKLVKGMLDAMDTELTAKWLSKLPKRTSTIIILRMTGVVVEYSVTSGRILTRTQDSYWHAWQQVSNETRYRLYQLLKA